VGKLEDCWGSVVVVFAVRSYDFGRESEMKRRKYAKY
jgi:hypothetical protein